MKNLPSILSFSTEVLFLEATIIPVSYVLLQGCFRYTDSSMLFPLSLVCINNHTIVFFQPRKISYRLLPNNAMKIFLSPSFLKSILYSPVCMYRKSPMLVPTAGHLGYFKYFATMNNMQCGLILCSLPFTQVWVYLKDKWLGDDFDRNGQTVFQRSWINLPSL